MILRNSTLSFASLAIPLFVGLLTVPSIINSLGLQRFGVLTLIWAVIGYASLFDLGISRALTKRVAELQAWPDRLCSLVRSGIYVLSALGLLMGALTWIVTRYFDYQNFGLNHDEFNNSALLLALNIPFVIVSGGFRGVLEGFSRFGIVSLVRLGFGLVTFTAPIFAIASYPRVDVIIAIMLVARIVGGLTMAWSCRSYLSKSSLSRHRRLVELKNLLTFGGWITVSNLASALMLYMDRFFLASSISAPSVAYYTTPYEFVTKLFILPSALSGVLFPLMARGTKFTDNNHKLLALSASMVLALVLPIITVLILFAPQILGWWISTEFGSNAAGALKILSIGVLVNCLAQIYQTYLLGRGKASLIARLHIIELLFFLPMLYLSIRYAGIEGAAWAWTARIIVDSVAMAFMLSVLKVPAGNHWVSLLLSITAAMAVYVSSAIGTYGKLLILICLVAVCTVAGLWFIRQLMSVARTDHSSNISISKLN